MTARNRRLIVRNHNLNNAVLSCDNKTVRQLAALFNTGDAHSRRALFSHVCDFVGLSRESTQYLHDALRVAATKQMRQAKGGAR